MQAAFAHLNGDSCVPDKFDELQALVCREQRQKAIIPFHSSTDAFTQFNYVHILQVLGYEDVEFIATVTNGLIQTRLNGYCAQ